MDIPVACYCSTVCKRVPKIAWDMSHNAAGSDLTTFTKSGPRPDPKVIAHRSPATRGEMLVMAATGALSALPSPHTILQKRSAICPEEPAAVTDGVLSGAQRIPESRLLQVNPGSWARFQHKAHINVSASCRAELYEEAGPHEDKCALVWGSIRTRDETAQCKAHRTPHAKSAHCTQLACV
jgi:hypothetical protein